MALVDNAGSTARDWCMLERNNLSHVRLCVVLSVLSSAVLLRVRLPSTDTDPSPPPSPVVPGLVFAFVLVVAALTALAAGTWEYWSGGRDLREMRAFLFMSRRVTVDRHNFLLLADEPSSSRW
ncbi:hypothetical protein DFH11DRAFT_1728912 [Phellopilus nigrolimitatus]|nr:hypothetical protein DFH11DRAFT_1728912 [Phellopilus nigrolimitatus]